MLDHASKGVRGVARMRPEIQLLRAVAVLGVVLAHVWPQRLPGGFAGVDVFFVVSGFLITRHLVGELGATGRIRFGEFWARRVRRLLPAAFVVLFAAFVLAMTLIPAPARPDTLLQLVGSAFYVENWMLVASSADYFASEQAPTLVQHYWSLSVEEQFYLVWPLLLAATWAMTRARRGRALAVVLAVGVVSFGIGIALSTSPSGYFSTATRVWEFCVGAVLALAPKLDGGVIPERFSRLRVFAGPIGLAMILGAFIVLGPTTPFPGFAALLPVGGAALVILGGEPQGRWSLGAVARWRPVLVVGDLSYSLYLWHWPLLVALPYAVLPFGGVNTTWRIAVVALAVLLAWATKRWVEDPFRRPRAGRHPARAFALPLVGGAAAFACVLAAQTFVIGPSAAAATARIDALRSSGCFGAEAVVNGCDDPFGPSAAIDPGAAAADRTEACPAETTAPPVGSVASCEYRVAGARGTLALVGDSHAGMMAAAVADWAERERWNVRLYEYPACPALGANPALAFPNRVEATSAANAVDWRSCLDYEDAVQRELTEGSGDIAAVLVTNATRSYFDAKDPAAGAITAGTVGKALDGLVSAGVEIVVLRDTPGLAFGQGAPMCLALHPDRPAACAIARADALPDADPMVIAARERQLPLVDLGDLFCDARRCYAAVGGVVSYWDRAHLTGTMRESLAPVLATRLSSAYAARG